MKGRDLLLSNANNHIHYFATANTAGGFTNELASSLQTVDRIIELRSSMHHAVSAFLQLIASQVQAQSTVWYIHHPLQSELLMGIILPERRIAVLYSNPHDTDMKIDITDKRLILYDLDQTCDQQMITVQTQKIDQLSQQSHQARIAAYTLCTTALRVHDDWEALYRPYIDFEKTNQVANQYLELLFADAKPQSATPKQLVRFLGTATATGAVDFVPSITTGLQKYHLKGRAGSGKSTILRKIAAKAEQLGYESEVYRCGLDPSSIDMVIVRSLNFAIFDSTPPHAHIPVAPDITIDLFELCMDSDADHQVANKLQQITAQYKTIIQAATAKLAEAAHCAQQIENIYEQHSNFAALNAKFHTIVTDFHHFLSND